MTGSPRVSNFRRWFRYAFGIDIICPTCRRFVPLSAFGQHSDDHWMQEQIELHRQLHEEAQRGA